MNRSKYISIYLSIIWWYFKS